MSLPRIGILVVAHQYFAVGIGAADPFDSFYIGNGVLNHAVKIQVIDVGLLRKRLIAYVKEMPPFVFFYGRPSSALRSPRAATRR